MPYNDKAVSVALHKMGPTLIFDGGIEDIMGRGEGEPSSGGRSASTTTTTTESPG